MATTIGEAMLEHLADGSVVMGRTLASQIGVPMEVLSDSGRRLEKRGFVTRTEGCYQITGDGKAFVSEHRSLRSVWKPGDFAARSRFSLRARVWNLIRIRTSWSIDDLLMTLADGTEKDAERGLRRYVRALLKAGYVEPSPRNPLLFRLVRNTGRCAPALNTPAKTLTDPNTGEVHNV